MTGSPTSPRASASWRSETGRPTIAWASVRASASLRGHASTTRPRRKIVTTSVAWRISSSLWLTRATALRSAATATRSTANSCSDSCGVSTDVGSSKIDDVGITAQTLDDLDPLARSGGEVTDDSIGIETEAVALADLADEVAGRSAVESSALAEGDVLPHPQLVDEAEVLVDHADAEGGGRLRVGDPLRGAVDAGSRHCPGRRGR